MCVKAQNAGVWRSTFPLMMNNNRWNLNECAEEALKSRLEKSLNSVLHSLSVSYYLLSPDPHHPPLCAPVFKMWEHGAAPAAPEHRQLLSYPPTQPEVGHRRHHIHGRAAEEAGHGRHGEKIVRDTTHAARKLVTPVCLNTVFQTRPDDVHVSLHTNSTLLTKCL